MTTVQDMLARRYTVNVRLPANGADGYHVVYTPRGTQGGWADGLFHGIANGGVAIPVPDLLEAIAQCDGDQVTVRWTSAQGLPEGLRVEFERDVQNRVRLLHVWLGRLAALINDVETWVKALDWSTRRIEKSMEDSQIGRYKAPCLLMQLDTNRVLLEPIARTAPGAEGVVDLYLMPAYDDIASLYFEDRRWVLHYLFSGTAAITPSTPAKLLSKETLQEVLVEMKEHAA